ncbi:MAG: hypothetical protein RMZ41_024120 [Nostoc sp. DedVER02]|uniref:hypothetical protein n=1 Tax=unclassified Nostoc TaxID=2593658 RepID=UPI002AD2DAA3|nr:MULTISPECIES: hypothetical protein [unclassified Nostoc]MDZ7990497.1 hypothetical protein [Nostoc sp. DedVER02]MDZ8113855.1 hypothetical protein [Nostoc sp. DedVER01b]
MKSLLLGLALAMFAVLPAAAENWIDLNEGGSYVVGIDTDSILTDNNGNYNFWIMHKDGQVIHQANAVISCRDRTIVFLANKSFNLDGELIEASPFNAIIFHSI